MFSIVIIVCVVENFLEFNEEDVENSSLSKIDVAVLQSMTLSTINKCIDEVKIVLNKTTQLMVSIINPHSFNQYHYKIDLFIQNVILMNFVFNYHI